MDTVTRPAASHDVTGVVSGHLAMRRGAILPNVVGRLLAMSITYGVGSLIGHLTG